MKTILFTLIINIGIIIIPISLNAQISWQRTYGSIYGDYGNSIFETKDSNVIAFGTFRRINLDNSVSNLLTIKKYNYNTNLIWEKEYDFSTIIENEIGPLYLGVEYFQASNFYYNFVGNLCFDIVIGNLHVEIDENTGDLLNQFVTKAKCNMALVENTYELFTDDRNNNVLDVYMTQTDSTYRHSIRIFQDVYPLTPQRIHTFNSSQITLYKDRVYILTDLAKYFIDTRPEVDPVLESSTTLLYILDTQMNFIDRIIIPRNPILYGTYASFISIDDADIRVKFNDLIGLKSVTKIIEIKTSDLTIHKIINTNREFFSMKYKANYYIGAGTTTDTTLRGYHINRTDYSNDGIIAKYDTNGTEYYYQLFGGSKYDNVRDAQPTVDGGIFVIASPNSIDGDITSPIITPAENQYMWVFKIVNNYNSIEENKFNDDVQVELYPNPFLNSFNIIINSKNNEKNMVVKIYNAQGEIVYLEENNELVANKINVELSNNLSAGVYYLKLIGKKTYFGKLIKQ